MNQPWNSGYVADIAYIEGFYVQQSPARMALACLFGNVAADLPEPEDEASYLELGCGCGIGALVTAAAEMKWLNRWSAAAIFEGQFSNVTNSYAGKGVVRYAW